ncbi:hypothetical protein D5018_16345 [Parashewanella curva]|uniref:Uncharacterized protein n=1 Tax=Parashewanella curva TaxID=2338552 RepID=A0A3L8PTL8_9GAMM|nr:hypothetical protein [Parashewanella curva]RLV58636.1 hypothetical protein D5018_16345 [Parashewanella curva]
MAAISVSTKPQQHLEDYQSLQTQMQSKPKYNDLSPMLKQTANMLLGAVPEENIDELLKQLNLLNTAERPEGENFTRIASAILQCVPLEHQDKLTQFAQTQKAKLNPLKETAIEGSNQIIGTQESSMTALEGLLGKLSVEMNKQKDEGKGLPADDPFVTTLLSGVAEIMQEAESEHQQVKQVIIEFPDAVKLFCDIVLHNQLPS